MRHYHYENGYTRYNRSTCSYDTIPRDWPHLPVNYLDIDIFSSLSMECLLPFFLGGISVLYIYTDTAMEPLIGIANIEGRKMSKGIYVKRIYQKYAESGDDW